MGLKTINAKHALARKEFATTIGAFVKEAKDINTTLTTFRAEVDELDKSYDSAMQVIHQKLQKAEQQAKGLKTHGIVQLDDFKRLLMVASANNWDPKPLKIEELTKLAKDVQQGLDDELRKDMDAYMEKQVASWPKEMKAGMTFNNKIGQVFELSGPPTQIPGKTGDAGFLYKGKLIKSYYKDFSPVDFRYSGAELNPQKGWKYVKT